MSTVTQKHPHAYTPRQHSAANDNRVAAVDTTVITADQALQQGTTVWQIDRLAERHLRLSKREDNRAIKRQRLTVVGRLEDLAKELQARVAA